MSGGRYRAQFRATIARPNDRDSRPQWLILWNLDLAYTQRIVSLKMNPC
jgi:hypothetical protein